MMSPLSLCDRVKSSRTLQGSTASICGIIGSLACIAVGIWMYIFLVFAYRDNKYQESYFEYQFAGTETMSSSKNIKLAMVFTNKTSNMVANHTQLRQFIKPRLYQSNQNGLEINFQPADYCDPKYFTDALNPIELEDCFLFTPDRLIQFSFNPNADIMASTVGFSFGYNCLNPFTCRAGGSALISVQNSLLGIFTNYHANLYFSVERLQQDGSFKHQVFRISSGQFTNSIGVAASINAQLTLNRIRLDQSTMPWNSIVKHNLLDYSGLVKGSTKASSSVYTPLPTYNIISSNFQTIIYKYGLKLDWLIGIIGGGFFINYLICLLLCFHYNQSLYRMRVCEQLILIGEKKRNLQFPELSKAKISIWYFLLRFSPLYNNAAMREATRILDISKIIKKLKLTTRNLKRYIDQNQLKIEDPQTFINYNQPEGQNREENYQYVQDEQYRKKINENSQLLGIHPEALKALQSQNASRIYCKSLTALYHLEDKKQFDNIKKIQYYQDEPKEKKLSCLSLILNFLKKFDLFSVKISFDSTSQSSTIFGTILSLLIIAAPILLLFRRVQQDSFLLLNSKQIMEGNQINYVLTSGDRFRPAVCFNANAVNNFLEGSFKSIDLSFFTYSQKLGYRYVGAKKLQAGMQYFLGISSESTFSKMDTSLCYVIPDGITVPMKGRATGDQSFFGYRITGYCSGTPSYCESIQSTTNDEFNYFLEDTSNTMTLYLPLNQYDETKQTVFSGNIYANQMREGIAGFSVTNSIEQTIFVDRIQLLDGKSRQFVGKQPQVIQDTIFSSRYHLNENTKQISNSSIAYYEARVRPSERISKVYMIGITTESMLGYIGGSIFLAYIVLAYIGRAYSTFVRHMRLAYHLYHDEIINKVNIFHQALHLIPFFPLRIFCCGNCGYSTRRMRQMQSKMKRDTNVIKIVKMVDICQKLAASLTNKKDVSELSRVFLKQRILRSKQISLFSKSQQEQRFDDNEQTYQQITGGNNKIQNTEKQKLITQKQMQQEEQENIQQDNLQKYQQDIIKDQSSERHIVKSQQPYEYKNPSYCLGNGCSLDFFQASAQLSFNNQWRIGSIVGFVLTIISIILIFLLFSAYKGDYNQARISSSKGIPSNLQQIPPLELHYSNFRIALGFIQKPSFAFKDVSSFITDTDSSLLGVQVIQFSQAWVNSTLVENITRYQLVACPQKYFDNFYSQNQDKEYFTSYRNGFCLPSNVTLLLAPQRQNNTQFFRFTIFPKTASGNSMLDSLVTSHVIGMYMTIPKIDQKRKKIYYSVEQIKPNTETLTKAYDVNLTLTKQKVTFTSPNYTINQNSSVIETYNYLENRNYEKVNIDTPTANPKIYNITFSYSGLQESYEETYPHFAEAYGVLGGIILVVFFTVGLIGHSYNNYLKLYLIGRQLYIPINKEGSSYNQLDVLIAWLLSFIAMYSKDYKFSKRLLNIHTIQQKTNNDINFFQFLRRLEQIKCVINNLSFQLQNNPSISLYNIPSKTIILRKNNMQFSRQDPFDQKQVLHNLTSRDAFRIHKSEQDNNVHFIDLIQSVQLNQNYRLPRQAKRAKNSNRLQQPHLKNVKKNQVISKYQVKAETDILYETPDVHPAERDQQSMRQPQPDKTQMIPNQNVKREVSKQQQGTIPNNIGNVQQISPLDSRNNLLEQKIQQQQGQQGDILPDLALTNKNSTVKLMDFQDFEGQQGE